MAGAPIFASTGEGYKLKVNLRVMANKDVLVTGMSKQTDPERHVMRGWASRRISCAVNGLRIRERGDEKIQ